MIKKYINKFVKNCGIAALTIQPFKTGKVNNTYLIKTKDKLFVLKEYKFTRKTKDIISELKFIQYLKTKGFPVPEPIVIKNKLILYLKKIRFVFFEYLPGISKDPNKLNQSEIKDLIFCIANMHKATKKLKINNIKPRRDMFTFDFEDFVIRFARKKRILLPRYMLDIIQIRNKLKEQLLPRAKLFEQIVIHNDLSLNNLKFENNKVSAILDFDDFCMGSRISDLANMLIDLCIRNNRLDIKKVHRFLKIYQQKSKLQKKELKIIYPLLLHRLSMYVYFSYFRFLINNNDSFKESKYYYNILKNSI